MTQRIRLVDEDEVEYPCSHSQQSQTFIFTKELTPSKMNTIPFITEEL